MTIKEVSDQLFSLSVGGYFNREKFTRSRLRNQIAALLPEPGVVTLEIALPDGWWYFNIFRYPDNCYQYVIPDTREQEARIKSHIFPA